MNKTVLQVLVPVLDQRRAPKPSAPLDNQLLYGETVRVIPEEGDRRMGEWLEVEHSEDAYPGFVRRDALGPVTGLATHRIDRRASLLFAAPDIKAPEPLLLSFGSRLEIVVEKGRFAETADGRFVIADHIARLDQLRPDYVATAELFLGAPYLWGGRSSFALDCSGLVQLVLAAAGIAIPRDSGPQGKAFPKAYDWTPHVTVPKRGDLLCMPGHAALVLDEARIIHSNAGAMACAIEDLRAFEERLKATDSTKISHAVRPSG